MAELKKLKLRRQNQTQYKKTQPIYSPAGQRNSTPPQAVQKDSANLQPILFVNTTSSTDNSQATMKKKKTR